MSPAIAETHWIQPSAKNAVSGAYKYINIGVVHVNRTGRRDATTHNKSASKRLLYTDSSVRRRPRIIADYLLIMMIIIRYNYRLYSRRERLCRTLRLVRVPRRPETTVAGLLTDRSINVFVGGCCSRANDVWKQWKPDRHTHTHTRADLHVAVVVVDG